MKRARGAERRLIQEGAFSQHRGKFQMLADGIDVVGWNIRGCKREDLESFVLDFEHKRDGMVLQGFSGSTRTRFGLDSDPE